MLYMPCTRVLTVLPIDIGYCVAKNRIRELQVHIHTTCMYPIQYKFFHPMLIAIVITSIPSLLTEIMKNSAFDIGTNV